MLKSLVLASALALPGVALACGGATEAKASTEKADATHASADATACAKKASLVGANCSYTTGMMAQRVVAEGTPWSYTGTMASSDNALSSHVAAPYVVGPDAVNVVATEVLESMIDQDLVSKRVTLDGKKLEVDGVTYFVLTSYAVPAS